MSTVYPSLLESAVAVGPRKIALRLRSCDSLPIFTICILVTDWVQLDRCLKSYESHGFDTTCCELLIINNTVENKADAYAGVNEFLQSAQGQFIILSHQDVVLIDDDRSKLEALLEELTEIDSNWGLCGNAGYTAKDTPALYISHPVSDNHICGGPFPAPVVSLDENFIVVRRAANLALSRDLIGFHHYGADLCIIADILGWNAYVISFKLHHFSGGTVDHVYDRSRVAIIQKYARALRPRWVNVVTERAFFISGSPAASIWAIPIRGTRNILRQTRFRVWLICARLRRRQSS